MQILSKATERYLKPVDPKDLRNPGTGELATMRVSLKVKSSSEEDLMNKEEEQVSKLVIELFDVETDSEGNTSETTPYAYAACSFVERRFKHGYTKRSSREVFHPRYEVPCTDYSLFLLLHTWTGRRIIDESAKLYLSEMIQRETNYSLCSERSARYKARLSELLQQLEEQKEHNERILETPEAKEILASGEYTPDNLYNHPYYQNAPEEHKLLKLLDPEREMMADPEFIKTLNLSPFLALRSSYNTPPELTLYQKVAASNAMSVEGYALYLEPGCGKTAAAIAVADYTTATCNVSNNRPSRILILMPKNIRQNWVQELQHFSKFNNHISILQAPNEQARNLTLLASLVSADPTTKSHVIIANYEAAVLTPLVLKVEWDLVILDESHMIANYSTKRSKFVLKLRDSAAKRLILTGTPIRNLPFDLFTQFEFLHKGGSGFDSFAKFKEFFGVWRNIQHKGIRILEELQNIPLLQERLAKQTFILKLKEAIPSLPTETYDIQACSLSEEQLQVYRAIATKLAAFLDSADQGIKDAMTINSHLTKLLRLAEITSGYACTDESGLYRFDPNPKLELLVEQVKEHLENDPDAKVQVWAHFTENIKQIAARFRLENIPTVVFYGGTSDYERIDAEREFNCNPNCRIFIGSPSAGGVGLNLLGFDPYNPNRYRTNCNWAIFYSYNWSSTARTQAKARAYRKGTRVHMRYTDFIVPGSIDSVITERVKAKIDMAQSIQEIKSILQNALNPQCNGD
jgi:SNF2 family DNA or RNA helicase